MNIDILNARSLRFEKNGKQIVNVDRLEVFDREILAIVGPNGAGKSTLLKVLHLIEPPTEGEITLFGTQVTKKNALSLRRRMTMVFQEPLLMDTSVYNNIAFGLAVRKMNRFEIEKRIQNYSLLLGINHLLSSRARDLSGGEAHRVALARALALEPEIIFLDEPLASLDPPSRELMGKELPKIFKGLRKTVIYVTQDRAEALTLGSDRIAVMMGGKIVQTGPTLEVLSHPTSEEAARFIGVENVWKGRIESVDEGLAQVSVGELNISSISEIEADKEVLVCVRPEELSVGLQPPSDSRRNSFKAKISALFYRGPVAILEMDGGIPVVAHITRHSAEELSLAKGSIVFVSFKATAVHLLERL